ncbi:MAG TPA: PAS domain-containing protein [Rhizomicrobium sp.]
MTNASDAAADTTGDGPDFAALFAKTPGLYLVLDTSFDIVAVNDAYCKATMTARDDILGHPLFQVFPDNPHDSSADGVQNLRASLLKVLKTREIDRMSIQKYDIERRGIGGFEVRYWSPLNIPVLGPDGYVKWIIYTVEDMTELANMRAQFIARREGAQEQQRILHQLHETQRELAAERDQNAELRETLRTQVEG